MTYPLGFLFLLSLFTGACVLADHSDCYYDVNSAAYYCEQDCDENSGAGIAGAVVGGILAIAMVIGITICISLHVNNKSHEANIQPNNGTIIHPTNNMPPHQPQRPLINSNGAPPPPPMYTAAPPIGTMVTS